jgi:transposase
MRAIGYSLEISTLFSDDRFGRALGHVYKVDRATLTTDLVTAFINAFSIKFERIHNDSTSVKAYGRYSEKTSTGFELTNGFSKDHRIGVSRNFIFIKFIENTEKALIKGAEYEIVIGLILLQNYEKQILQILSAIIITSRRN